MESPRSSRSRWWCPSLGRSEKGTATIFGPGTARANYIAVDDVAEFVVKILAREDIVDEVIEIGGPSTRTMPEVTALVEKQLGRAGRPKNIPVFALQLLPAVVRFFNERAARLMTLGHYMTTDRPFAGWQTAAERFGVRPRTLEEHVARLPK